MREEKDDYGSVTATFYDAAYGAKADLGTDISFYKELARATGGRSPQAFDELGKHVGQKIEVEFSIEPLDTSAHIILTLSSLRGCFR